MRFLWLAVPAALLLAGCVDAGDFSDGDAVHQTIHRSIALAPHADIRIGNVSGSIVVVPWARRTIDIVARKHAVDMAAMRSTTIVVTSDGTPATYVDVHTHYGRHWALFWGESGADVEYTIHVPRDVSMTLDDVSGNIRVSGVSGAVSVNDVSGDVEALRIDGDLRVHTVSGSTEASLLSMGGGRDVVIGAVSGSIHLTVPPNAGANVDASSISGSFDSDFNVPTHERMVGVDAGGRIGNGDGTIELKTISGSMTLSKS